jgi:hypothetical protein
MHRVSNPGQWILAGDDRINENPVLHSLFHLFRSYHNRIAEAYTAEHPAWSDDEVFQEARSWNIAVYQKIVTREFLASFTGRALLPYIGSPGQISYNASLNPEIDAFFATVAFPALDALKVSSIPRLDDSLASIAEGPLLVRDTIDNPTSYYVENTLLGIFNDSGVMKAAAHAEILRGVSNTAAGRAEPSMIDDLRNFLFDPTDSRRSSDVVSLHIQRGRDHGIRTIPSASVVSQFCSNFLLIASYNTARGALKLPRITSWAGLTSDVAVQRRLQSVYGDVDSCDPWVCGLAETLANAGAFGPLFKASIIEQFTRTRNGDRFWYEMPGRFSEEDIEQIHGITLGDIIKEVYPDVKASNALPISPFFLSQRQLYSTSASSCIYDPLPPGFLLNAIQLSPQLQLSWCADFQRREISFIIQACVQGWVGIGFDPEPNSMAGADIILCRYLADTQTSECTDRYAIDVGVPVLDTSINGTDDITFSNGTITASGTRKFFITRKFDTGDSIGDKVLGTNLTNLIFAYNPDTVSLSYHGPSRSGANKMRFVPAVAELGGGLLAFAGIFSSLGMVLSIGFLALVFFNGEQFKYQSPFFCCILLVGALVGHASVWTFLPSISDVTCIVDVWLINLSFVMVFACLSLKTWRTWRVGTMTKLKLNIITVGDLMKMFSVLGTIEIAVLVLWTVLDRPQALTLQDKAFGSVLSSYHLVCKSPLGIFWYISIAMKLVYLSACAFVTFKIRNLPAIFNDSRQIAVSIFIATFSLIILIIVSVVLEWSVEATFITRTIGSSIPYTAICIVLFGNTSLRIIKGLAPLKLSTHSESSRTKKTNNNTDTRWRTEASMHQNGANMASVLAEHGSPRLSFTEDVNFSSWMPTPKAASSSSDSTQENTVSASVIPTPREQSDAIETPKKKKTSKRNPPKL